MQRSSGSALNLRSAGWLAVAILAGSGCAGGRPRLEDPKQKEGPLRHYQLARMYYEQGRVQEALKELDTSLRLDDKLPQVHFYRGYIRWNQEEWKAATEAFQRAIQINPYFTEARQYLAFSLEKSGDVQGALDQLDLALRDKTYGQPEQILLNRAVILRHQGKLEPSLAELRQAVGLKPRYYRGHYEMATLLEDLRRFDEALLAYTAAEPGYTNDPEYHYRYGAALFRQGHRTEATRELRRALELAPGSEVAAKANELLGVIG